MSTKRSFGRFTAMGLAGLTAVSSMAIIANAEAYPSYVYEFTYSGISSTPMYFSASVAASNNTYANDTLAKDVFTDGFVVKDLDDFALDGAVVNCSNANGTGWRYNNVNAISGIATPVLPSDYLKKRDDLSVITSTNPDTFYFKSKAERSTVMSTIVSSNKSDYTTKYNAALAKLGTDLTSANTALYNKEMADAKDVYDLALAAAGNDATLKKQAADDYTAAKKLAADNRADRTKKITTVKAEFTEAYKPANWAFNATDEGANSVFVTADGAVEFGGHVGDYVWGAGATYKTLDLSADFYRTVGAYNSDESYAFTGEIIPAATRNLRTAPAIKAYLLDSDRWSQFSALIEGGNADNDNTTEPGKDTDETTTDTWYPDSSAYRVYNSDGISYLGKNGKWYTSSAAATLYGGGYTGQFKASNYSSVKDNNTLYFSADDGNYYTTSASAGSHSYVVKNVTTTTTTTSDKNEDPYYYYYMMGNTTTSIDPDAPTIYGSSKRSGWDRISTYIKASKKGATVKIDMNAATTVPASVLATAKEKGVNLTFVNENGAKITVKAGSISTSSSLNVAVKYNVKNIRSSLVTAAKKVNPGTVSTAQIQVGDSESFGGTVTATVKMSSKRAGDTVKAYRLTDSGKLTREATGVVKADGTLSFNLKNGGSYLLVVIE